MKRIFTILALSLLCLTSNAQLVWKISGNGIKKPSYISEPITVALLPTVTASPV